MLITVDSVPDGGLEVHASRSHEWALDAARLALDVDADGVELLDLSVTVTLIADHMRVKGRMDATIRRSCDRCGAGIRLLLSDDMDLYYSPHGLDKADAILHDPDIELESGDMDIGWFDGRALDMRQVLSEQLTLWLPERVTCDSPGAVRNDPERSCEVFPQDSGPDLDRHSPFSGLRLPE